MLTQSELKGNLHYDEETGLFTQKIAKRNVEVGDIAGCFTTDGYIVIVIDGKPYKAHRLAWLYVTGSFPEGEIDHINHIRDDNTIENLRDASSTDNNRNKTIGRNNASGVVGVSWGTKSKRWRAAIGVDNKKINLGDFIDFHEAVNARKNAEVLYGYHDNHGNHGQ